MAKAMKPQLDAIVLDKDVVRESLFADRVDYSNTQNDLCIEIIYKVAHYLMTGVSPPVVILDGRTYSKRYQVDALIDFAQGVPSRLKIIECVCSEQTARERLALDEGMHLAKDRDFKLYLASKSASEPITVPRLTLDTGKNDLPECVQQALQYVSSP